MEDEFREMDDLSTHVEPDPEGDHETSFIENYLSGNRETSLVENDLGGDIPEQQPELKQPVRYEDTIDFFTNVLDLEPQCNDPKFIDYLTSIRVLGVMDSSSGSSVVILDGDFKSAGDNMTDEKADLLRRAVRLHYDEWTERERNKVLKKAGIAAAVGLGVIALITGLSVGLTRKGADIVHQAKKWEKLTPAKKSIPWTELEKATGKVVIFTGEHIVIIITLVGIFLYSK